MICSTCMGKLQGGGNMAWFSSAATLRKCDCKTLLVISIGIINNRSSPQFIC